MIIRKLSREVRDHETLDSTNLEMSRLLDTADLAEGTVIRADYQQAGRGHAGNSWQSERGRNLLFSLLLKPEFLDPSRAFHLSRITSLALYETIDNQCDGIKIKWPNDLLAGDRKLAGMLIENIILGNTISHSILGVGLNVNQTVFDPSIPAPTSLKIEKGCHIGRNDLLEAFIDALEGWYQALLSGEEERIMGAYREKLYGIGIPARFRAAGGDFSARIRDVRVSGEIELELEQGDIVTYGFKEVESLGINPPDQN
jgi:BirA family biotin operon repressor/biotin-[acetyl-CoA-carboxylase] ligase